MIQLGIEGSRIVDLVAFLSTSSPDTEEICKANIVKDMDGKRVGFFVFENYYFRTQASVSGAVFLYQTSPTTCEIVIVGSGGASMIGGTWGAQRDIEEKISKAILNHVRKLNMKSIGFRDS